MKYSTIFIFLIGLFSCKQEKKVKEQSISLSETNASFDTSSGINSSKNFSQLNTSPSNLIFTGINKIRLLPIYKSSLNKDKNILYVQGITYNGF
jgi:hypothetical protein